MTQPEAGAGEDDGGIVRVPSHVPGLDAILCGGFLQGGLYLVQGPPGTGKTILASQVLYGHAAAGGRALFFTVLGESYGRMFSHLRPMRFFDLSATPDKVAYFSAYQALEDQGLKGLLTLLGREVLARQATLLVLDGMSAVEAKAGAGFEMKRLTYELQTLASATNCTMLLLTTASGAMSAPEHTMVDGLIELRQRLYGLRNERRLLVHKFRGTGFLEGEHALRITREGVTVFPRIEALLATPTRRDTPPDTRVPSGVASFDALLGGGIPAATMTALMGPSGAGKTTLGLHFLSGSSADEPGLLFGCDEPPERLRPKAATMGFDLAAAEQRGDVELLWFPTGEHILDELAHRLLDAVRRRGVKRLVIDGVSGFQQAALEPERIVRFWSALSNELRGLGVTTVFTLGMPDLMETDIRVPVGGLSLLADVIVFVRYVELRSRLYRLVSLFKVREGAFDPSIREFTIGNAGVVVGEPFEGVEAVLGGMARQGGAGPPAGGSVRERPGRACRRPWPAWVSGMATVLIVEDEFAITDLLEMALTDEGYQILTAANGRQGLECLAKGPRPDLVITDYMMPVLDGVGMLRAMQTAEAQRDIPCIVMSAVPEENVRARIEGYVAFVPKPFQILAVVRLVAAILGTARPVP